MNDDSINSFRQLRVMGTVKDNSIVFNSDGSIEFKIEDSGKEIFVQYKGIIPDIFKDGVEAVVEGDFDGSVFTAKKLFAKCPTKYEDEEYRKELTWLILLVIFHFLFLLYWQDFPYLFLHDLTLIKVIF